MKSNTWEEPLLIALALLTIPLMVLMLALP